MVSTRIRQWRVGFREGRELLLYADEGVDLSLLDFEMRSTTSIKRTEIVGLGEDGINLHDGREVGTPDGNAPSGDPAIAP